MFGISIKADTLQHRVSIVNEKVDIFDFFLVNIVLELQDKDYDNRPIVKA